MARCTSCNHIHVEPCPVCGSAHTWSQTYYPDTRAVAPYPQGRCTACNAKWDRNDPRLIERED